MSWIGCDEEEQTGGLVWRRSGEGGVVVAAGRRGRAGDGLWASLATLVFWQLPPWIHPVTCDTFSLFAIHAVVLPGVNKSYARWVTEGLYIHKTSTGRA